MPDSEISKQSPEIIYGDGKKRILESIAGQSVLPPDLRDALANGVEKIFKDFAGRESRTAASDGLPVAEEARDSEVELRERLMAELVEVWNKTPEADRYFEARIQELERKGWFVSKAPSGVRFAKYPESEEVFCLPGMPGWFKGNITSYFDTIDLTPNIREEQVVVGLTRPGVFRKDITGRLLARIADWNNYNEMPMLAAAYASGATKGLIEVKCY